MTETQTLHPAAGRTSDADAWRSPFEEEYAFDLQVALNSPEPSVPKRHLEALDKDHAAAIKREVVSIWERLEAVDRRADAERGRTLARLEDLKTLRIFPDDYTRLRNSLAQRLSDIRAEHFEERSALLEELRDHAQQIMYERYDETVYRWLLALAPYK